MQNRVSVQTVRKCGMRVVLGGAAWALMAALPSQAALVADFRVDFTTNHNGHADTRGDGHWWYYRSATVNPADPDASLALLSWVDTPNPQYGTGNLTTDPQVRSTNMHPLPAYQAVARWENGRTGKYAVSGVFSRNPNTTSGNGVTVYVFSQGSLKHTEAVPAATGYPASSFSFVTDLTAGGTVDFVVASNGEINSDRTDFSVTVVDFIPFAANGSFESPEIVAPDTGSTATIPYWTKKLGAWASPGVQLDTVGSSPSAPDGDQWAFFNLVGSAVSANANEGMLWQQVGLTHPVRRYTVEYILGRREQPIGLDHVFEASFWVGGTAPSAANGATLLGSAAAELPAASGAVTTNRLTVETGPAQEIQPLWVRFRAAISPSDTAGNNQILLDHVRVSALEGFSGTLITVE
ncbi:MAG: hypothetical protein RBT78_03720 [Kiritimatiellia bacterium]|nr:hypothetical protein [Kiritimatiellia bacterium]